MGRANQKRPAQNGPGQMRPVFPNAAGIDIGATAHYAAVPPGRDAEGRDVRHFEAYTCGLRELADWLKRCGVDTVVMESTGVYWIPLYELLESRGFDVRLVDARHAKNVPGRKTDAEDCQWLQQLHACGLLSAAFRPEEQVCVLRSYIRQRAMLLQCACGHVQHMQKALSQMNVKLQHVVSDITGETGMKIIRAILAGERNPRKLAEMRDKHCKNPVEVIAKSLEGNYREEHLFELRQAVELYDSYLRMMAECDVKMEACLKEFDDKSDGQPPPSETNPKSARAGGNSPGFNMADALFKMAGVDLTTIDGISGQTGSKVLGETGTDMSRWPTVSHFVSWLGLCPGNRKSGGKQISGKTKPCANRAAGALRVAAQTLRNSKSALGAHYRRMRAKLGAPMAITATAHKLARIIYAMLKSKRPYKDIGAEAFDQQFRDRQINGLKRRARDLGFDLVEAATAINA